MSSEVFPERLATLASEEFRRACGRFASGVTVATVVDSQGTPHGVTVSSFSPVSLSPPLVSICLGHQASLIDLFRATTYFGINILAESQKGLSERFARRGPDRFEGVSWSPGQTGAPLLTGALAALECSLEQRFPVGDHDIFVGRLLAAEVHEGKPLVHFSGGYRDLRM